MLCAAALAHYYGEDRVLWVRKGSEIKNKPKWTERQIKALRNPDKPCWIFLDQIDLLRKNKSDEGLQFDLVDDLPFNIVKKHDMVYMGLRVPSKLRFPPLPTSMTRSFTILIGALELVVFHFRKLYCLPSIMVSTQRLS